VAKQIAQVAPRRASRALLRIVLQQLRDFSPQLADEISRFHLGRTVAEVVDANWVGPLTDQAFADAFSATMTLIIERCASREGRAPMTKEEAGLLFHCVIHCATLREAIERSAAFMRALASNPGRLSLEIHDDLAEFIIETSYTVRDLTGLLTDLSGLAAFHRFFGWLIDMPVELQGIRMCYPPLLDSGASAFMIPYPITYNAETNAFRFPAELLDRPVLRHPRQLATLLRHFPFDVNDTQVAHETLTNRVRSVLASALSKPEPLPTEIETAERLRISLSTLKRRLHAEETSFRIIRDGLLCTIAIDCIESERYSIGELSRRLGFADIASFRHAFKRWTGASPGRYRSQGLA
jgi:AraC-like DNA-binding protein